MVELVTISDIYGNKDFVSSLISKLDLTKKDERIAIILGDIEIRKSITQEEYIETLNKILSALKEVSKYVVYVPGDTDDPEQTIEIDDVFNLDKKIELLVINSLRIGFLGLGGAPKHSIRRNEPATYLWDEDVPLVYEDILKTLRINYEKLKLDNPDMIILVSHSPPYGIADYSSEITLRDMAIILELSEENKETEEDRQKDFTKNPKHLGSRILRDFIQNYKVDLHLFGHVHKQGGRISTREETTYINVGHLSTTPYKLTGRKYAILQINEKNLDIAFDSIVDKNLPFSSFVETYV